MNKLIFYRFVGTNLLLCLFCLGLVWNDTDIIIDNYSAEFREVHTEFENDQRELALVRRQVPSVTITNVTQKVAEIGTSLFDGDTLRTDVGGYAMVLFMDQSVTKVLPETQLIVRGQVNPDRSSTTRIDVETGEIFMNVNPRANSMVEIGTSTSVASVKGTEFGARSSGYYWVVEGEIEVLALQSGVTATLTEGMFAQINQDGTDFETGELAEDQLRNLETEYGALENSVIERQLRLRFMDENGQIRDVELDYTEQ